MTDKTLIATMGISHSGKNYKKGDKIEGVTEKEAKGFVETGRAKEAKDTKPEVKDKGGAPENKSKA